MTVGALAAAIRPCGPVLPAGQASRERTFEALDKAAAANGWMEVLAQARAALDPVFAAAPYLAGLARRRPAHLSAILSADPADTLSSILSRTTALEHEPLELAILKTRLRELKAEIHLLTALADLGGVWDLDEVTGALTRFADAAVKVAMAAVVRAEIERGRVIAPIRDDDGEAGPLPGLFCIAMGKYGAFELNYSSDIDFSLFYEPDALPLAEGVAHQGFTTRFAQTVAEILHDRTGDGYVFRVDLRLRPDPSTTPPAVPVEAALDYYQTVGQNWERAAFIKARACAGDIGAGLAFLDELQPFIWRRNLDFAAIADIHSIKRQIHIHKVDDRLTAKGADVKLGHGGIREIEFFVQTQQLILGGRDASLRSSRTTDALADLARAGRISPQTAGELTLHYAELRALEHRAQMVADEQTHKLPEADAERAKIAALSGDKDLKRFDARVEKLLRAVNARYGELFSDDEDLSSSFGSLVFTGVEDDPETLRTLKRMGFSEPARISATIRAWHHGRIRATHTEQGRELFTRLAPRLLEATQATGAPDDAFRRFAEFFSGLTMGVQVQSLFLAQPNLLELIVRVMAFAPRLAAFLARSPAALDSLMDAGFFGPFAEGEIEAVLKAGMARAEPGFEAAMDAARRLHREQAFRIGVQVMSGAVTAAEAGPAFADLADACIRGVAGAALAEVERLAGVFSGEVAVIALGKCGSREMTAGSDLDLMTVYRAEPGATSEIKGLEAAAFYARFTQRLIAGLSAPTAEGDLYAVDMRLRPSGNAGPVAVSRAAFQSYYAQEAETWEFQALTRARVVWASSPAFADTARSDIEAALRQPRDPVVTARAVRDMRTLMAKELPPTGFWDLKRSPGGLVDIEFVAQFLQILHAPQGGPLRPNTGEALAALNAEGLIAPKPATALNDTWRLQQDLSQVLKVALAEDADPAGEPAAFKALLAKAGGCADFEALRARLRGLRNDAHKAFDLLVADPRAATSDRATD